MKTRLYMAEVTPMSRTRPARCSKIPTSSLGPSEELDQQGAGHVETLGHRVGHLRVQVCSSRGDGGEPPADPAGGDEEHRREGQATRVIGHDR